MPVMPVQPLQTGPRFRHPDNRKRFTQTEFVRMMELGLLDGQRLELVDGDLIDKMGQNPPHATAIQRLTRWLAKTFGLDLVRAQLPIQVAGTDREFTLPEPDFAVVREDKADYANRHPSGTELLLVVEIADSSIQIDRTVKPSLYARAGIPEYWVLDIPGQRMIVHRHPAQGEYTDIGVVDAMGSMAPESMPTQTVSVQSLLP